MRTTIAWLAVTALVLMDGAMTLEAALLRSKTAVMLSTTKPPKTHSPTPAGPPLYKLHLDNKMCLATTTSDCEGLFGTSIAVPCRSNMTDLVRYNAKLNILAKPDNSKCLRLEFVINKFYLKIYWIPFDKSLCSKFPGVSLLRESWFEGKEFIEKTRLEISLAENPSNSSEVFYPYMGIYRKNQCGQNEIEVLRNPIRFHTPSPTKKPTTKRPTRPPTSPPGPSNDNGIKCASEDGWCECKGEVRYGDEKNRWTGWIHMPENTNRIKCSHRSGGFFKFDPAKRTVKACFCRDGPTPAEKNLDVQKERAAEEGQTFTCPGGLVSYGTELAERRTAWRSDLGDGSIRCNNGAFGSDPHKHSKKWCYCAPKPARWLD